MHGHNVNRHLEVQWCNDESSCGEHGGITPQTEVSEVVMSLKRLLLSWYLVHLLTINSVRASFPTYQANGTDGPRFGVI